MCIIQYYQIVSFIDQKKSTERLKFFEKQSISLYFDIDMMTTVTCCLMLRTVGQNKDKLLLYTGFFSPPSYFLPSKLENGLAPS